MANEPAGEGFLGAPVAGGGDLRRPRRPQEVVAWRLGPTGQEAVLEADRGLAEELRRATGGEPEELLAGAFAKLPDGPRLLEGLRRRPPEAPRLVLARLESGPLLAHSFPAEGLIGLHRLALAPPEPGLRALLFQVAVLHELRRLALPAPAPKPEAREAFETLCFKRSLGLALLLLAAGEPLRRGLRLPHRAGPLAGALAAEGAFPRALRAAVSQLFAPALAERLARAEERAGGNVFTAPALFDARPAGEKLRAIAAANLAWYSFLFFRLPRLAAPLWRRLSPHYEVAFLTILLGLKRDGLFKKGFGRRFLRALARLRLGEASEYFWSGWSPALTRVALRPFYRLLGGNQRPFLATAGTFLYTALVVHLLGFAALAVAAAHLAGRLGGPPWLAALGAPANALVLLAAVGAYLFCGVLAGLAKKRRQKA